MEIIFTQTWMAWLVGILIGLVVIKILLFVFILILGLRILKKIDNIVEEFGDWSSYVMDEATATLDEIAKLRINLKNYLSIAGIINLITKIFKQSKRRG